MTDLEYLKSLKDNIIKYRYNLNILSDITFGIEIEYENIVNDTLTYLLNEQINFNKILDGWINKREVDIAEYNDLYEEMNGEINSPILSDSTKTWESLRNILFLLRRNGAIVTEKCGTHINIGAHIFENKIKYFRNFFLLWMLYEEEIYKFCSGEYKCVRTRNNHVIDRVSKILKENINFIISDSIHVYGYLDRIFSNTLYKSCDISLDHFSGKCFEENNRIEFRLPNATLKEEILQNYINFFVKFLIACKKELDIEKTLYKINNNKHSIFELVDYIFEDDTDKEYFLIQALKTNKIYNKNLKCHLHY